MSKNGFITEKRSALLGEQKGYYHAIILCSGSWINDNSESQGQQGRPIQLLCDDQISNNGFIVVQDVTRCIRWENWEQWLNRLWGNVPSIIWKYMDIHISREGWYKKRYCKTLPLPTEADCKVCITSFLMSATDITMIKIRLSYQ